MHKLREFEGIYEANYKISAGFSLHESSCRLEFRLSGPLDELIIPPKAQAARFRDELWKHTCFEAFFLDANETSYWEFNFSPSRDWAIYRFSDYRQRIEVERLEEIDLVIQQERYPGELLLKVDLKPKERFQPRKIGLTSVLEHSSGQISYWSLLHARAKPDFHAKEGFTLQP